MKKISDIINKIDKKFIIVIQDQQEQSQAQEEFNELITTEIKELLNELIERNQDIREMKEMESVSYAEGYNRKVQELREDIDKIIG